MLLFFPNISLKLIMTVREHIFHRIHGLILTRSRQLAVMYTVWYFSKQVWWGGGLVFSILMLYAGQKWNNSHLFKINFFLRTLSISSVYITSEHIQFHIAIKSTLIHAMTSRLQEWQCVWEIFCLQLGQITGYSDWGFMWFSSVILGKC